MALLVGADDLGLSFWPRAERVEAGGAESLLDARGAPLAGMETLLTRALSGIAPGDARLLLPAKMVRARRIRARVPVGGKVGHAHVREGLAALERQGPGQEQVVLYRQPTAYFIDGLPGDGDPVGTQAMDLEVEAVALTAQMAGVSAFDAVFRAGGLNIVDVITPHAALAHDPDPAVAIRVHVRPGETLVVEGGAESLRSAASIAVGTRHMMNDIMHLASVNGEAAREILGAALADADVGDATLPAVQIVDARLAELTRFVIDALEGVMRDRTKIALSVEGFAGARLAETLASALECGCESRTVDAFFLLGRAASLIAAGPPFHHPAQLAARAPAPAQGIWGWLQARF